MAYVDQLVKLDWRYAILLLLCLSILVVPHINWKTKGTVRTRKTAIVISKRTIQATKARQLPNNTQAGVYESNDMGTRADTCCAGANWRLI